MDNETIIDYITGKRLPNVGSEANRQAVERFLVEKLGYSKNDIAVNYPVSVESRGSTYSSRIDLVVFVEESPVMVVLCAAGSLDSWSRQIISAARIAFDYVVPLAVVSDGASALGFDSWTRKRIFSSMDSMPGPGMAYKILSDAGKRKLDEDKAKKERIIFTSYDSMRVNLA